MSDSLPIVVTVQPTVEPISTDEAKLHLRVDLDVEDDLIDAAVMAARSWVETFTRRKLITQTVTLQADGLGNGFRLPLAPVQSIDSITYTDTAGVIQTLASSEYRLVKSRVPSLIVPAFGVTWPTARAEMDTVTITLICGYGGASVAVPPDLISAVRLMTGHFFTNRSNEVAGTIVSKVTIGAHNLCLPYVLHN